jgi:hypothetical protein
MRRRCSCVVDRRNRAQMICLQATASSHRRSAWDFRSHAALNSRTGEPSFFSIVRFFTFLLQSLDSWLRLKRQQSFVVKGPTLFPSGHQLMPFGTSCVRRLRSVGNKHLKQNLGRAAETAVCRESRTSRPRINGPPVEPSAIDRETHAQTPQTLPRQRRLMQCETMTTTKVP